MPTLRCVHVPCLRSVAIFRASDTCILKNAEFVTRNRGASDVMHSTFRLGHLPIRGNSAHLARRLPFATSLGCPIGVTALHKVLLINNLNVRPMPAKFSVLLPLSQ